MEKVETFPTCDGGRYGQWETKMVGSFHPAGGLPGVQFCCTGTIHSVLRATALCVEEFLSDSKSLLTYRRAEELR